MEEGSPFLHDILSRLLRLTHTYVLLECDSRISLTDCFSWWCVYYVSLSATTLSCDFSWLLSPLQRIFGDHFVFPGLVGGCLTVSHGVSPVSYSVFLVPSCSRGHQTPVSKSVSVLLYGTSLSTWEPQLVYTLSITSTRD